MEIGAAYLGDVGVEGGGVVGGGVELAGVAGGVEVALALGLELLEDGIRGCAEIAATPRAGEGFCGIVRGHLVEDVGGACALIEEDLGEAGSHAGDLDDVEDLLAVVTGAVELAGAAEAIDEDVFDGNLGAGAGLGIEEREVGGYVAIEGEDADGLAGAGECGATIVGGAHVAGEVGAAGAGTLNGDGGGLLSGAAIDVGDGSGAEADGGGDAGGGCGGGGGLFLVMGVAGGGIVKAGDGVEGDGGVGGGFAVWGVEVAAGGVLVGVDEEMKGRGDGGDGAIDVNDVAVAGSGGDGEAFGLGPGYGCVVVCLRGLVGSGELLGGEVVVVHGAGRIVDLGDEGIQGGLIAEWQAEGQLEMGAGVSGAEEFSLA